MTKSNGITNWLKQNAWTLIVFAGGLIVMWTSLNFRVNAMEKQLSQYPSQDYFDLKFATTDQQVAELKKVILDHINEK